VVKIKDAGRSGCDYHVASLLVMTERGETVYKDKEKIFAMTLKFLVYGFW